MFNILRVTGANATVEIRLDDLRVLHRLREAYKRGGFATQVLQRVVIVDQCSPYTRREFNFAR